MTRTVALTGVSGFVGGQVAQALLEAGWRVRALARRPFSSTALAACLPVDVVPGSLEDPAGLRHLTADADAVVHVAGLVKARSRRMFFQANEGGVANLLDAIRAQGACTRVIHISSLAAREPGISAYAASKRAGEALLAERGADLSWTVLRPPVVYGPRDRNTLPFFRAIARGIGPLLAPDAARISCLHVADLARAVVALLESNSTTCCKIYEIDDDAPGGYSWRDLIETAASPLKARPRMIRIPRGLLEVSAHATRLSSIAVGRSPIFGPDKVREMHHLDWVSRASAKIDPSIWRPRTTLQAGFAETIEWYIEANWL